MLETGSSLDIMVSELAMGYENYLNRKAQGKAPLAPDLTQEEMLAMIAKARAK